MRTEAAFSHLPGGSERALATDGVSLVTLGSGDWAFIDAYRSLPELWDTTCVSYSNRVKKVAAYDVLIEKLKPLEHDATRDSAVKKINNLRSVFRKELKKINESKKSGASANDNTLEENLTKVKRELKKNRAELRQKLKVSYTHSGQINVQISTQLFTSDNCADKQKKVKLRSGSGSLQNCDQLRRCEPVGLPLLELAPPPPPEPLPETPLPPTVPYSPEPAPTNGFLQKHENN
ncbi:hypothetical protein J437_LFUL007575 [Ladona fulva]|uniref:MADF domain-containing protein n=1 Tax=Ladona fulva TaxID=123851 RepID=A0A8K0K876_LADFU|nr:hypothetical protein J437_LFUL007575 [Ladona fulva]